MEITVAKYAGFCFGVERAVNTVYDIIKEHKGKKIYTLGLLIHNPVITESLRQNGVEAIEEDRLAELLAQDIENAIFVIRAHGIKKEISEKIPLPVLMPASA